MLSETSIHQEQEAQDGVEPAFLIILYQSGPMMGMNCWNSLILGQLLIYAWSQSERKGMLSMLLITALSAMIQ